MISIHNIKQTINTAMIGGAIAIANTIDAFAMSTDWLKEGNGTGQFDEVIEETQGFFNDLYSLIGVVCVFLAVIFLIIAGLKFMRGNRHAEAAKDDILNWLIGGGLIFGAVGAVSMLIGVFN